MAIKDITTKDVFMVARKGRRVLLEEICPDAEVVRQANEDYMRRRLVRPVYGDTTGYGVRVEHRVPAEKHREKQRNLVYSLNCGSGEHLRGDQVRAAMFVRLLVLSKGNSCVRPAILKYISEMLNRGNHTPLIPCFGSIGASGDLVPSSYYAIHVFKDVGLEGREGLALVNGTHFMTGISALVLEDFRYLCGMLIRLFAILFQCHGGIKDVFDEELHTLKKHKEQRAVANLFRDILRGSKLLRSVEELTNLKTGEGGNAEPIQDRYSMRCLPQFLGPVIHRIIEVRGVVEDELISVSDNPVLINGEIKHGGHFDGSYIADAMEGLKRSIKRMAYAARAYMRSTTDAKLNHDLLPTYLVANDDGLNNGLQGLVISFGSAYWPLVKASIPDDIGAMNDEEGTNQDVVSMGMHSALSASDMISKLTTLTAALMIMTRQAVYLRKIEDRLSPKTQVVLNKLAKLIPPIEKDRSLDSELRGLEDVLFRHAV